MKKFLVFLIIIGLVIFIFGIIYIAVSNPRCVQRHIPSDKASSVKNYDCSFFLQTPIRYDKQFGVGILGQVYKEENKPSTKTLWLGKDFYDKLIKSQDTTGVKLYKGKCLIIRLNNSSNYYYFVYYAE